MKIISRFIFCFLIFLATPSLSFAWNSSVVLDNGDPSNRINIVFLGDGYQASEMSKYATDVQNTLDYILSTSPFSDYASYINAYKVDVISNESGADHPDQGIYVDTALDSSYTWDGSTTRLLYADGSKVFAAADDSPVPATMGMVFVIVNDAEYGGGGGAFAVFSTHSSSDEIAVHELGHSFGKLADEYFYSGTTYTGAEPIQPNVTIETSRSSIKWTEWIDGSTPVPTPWITDGIPGLYEGGMYNDFGIYRPTYNSKMRALYKPFEQINTEQLIKRIYNFVSPVDSISPVTGTTNIPSGGGKPFVVSLMSPAGHSLAVEWYLNDDLVGTERAYTVSASDLTQSNDVLRAEIKDPTDLVRNDPSTLLTETVSWDLVLSTAPTPSEVTSPIPGDTITSTNMTFKWTPGIGVISRWLYIGTTGVGSNNIYSAQHTYDSEANVSGIPLTGNLLYVRLWSWVNGSWQLIDYVYQTQQLFSPSEMTAPLVGSTITTSSVTFQWTPGDGLTGRALYIGTTGVGSSNVYSAQHGADTQATVSGIPLTGNPIYVRLWSWSDTESDFIDYVYQTQPLLSEIIEPTPGSTITTSSVVFQWVTGQGVTSHWLYAGTTGPGSSNIHNASAGSSTSASVSGIPLGGGTLYVRLWSWKGGAWQSVDYTYSIQ